MTPEELCAKYNKIHKEVYDWFEINFDIFGRTPTEQHTQISQQIFLRLRDNGFLIEKTAEQPFCEQHQSFLADRFVEGECPHCHYDDARGDQCDKCGHVLDPFDLIKPHCKLDGATPVPRPTTHTHMLLDKLQPEIEAWLGPAMERGGWPKNSRVIAQSWLKEGLRDRGITRDLKWGVPVPLPGYEKKVLYVWFEACIGYPSITAVYTPEWERWWRNPDNVELYQFLGKDNTPFHAVIFPGTQIGTRDPWTRVHHLSTTEYLNYENGKFSKSRGIGVFGNSAKEVGLHPDVWRYYLLKNRPETGDTQFEWRSFVETNNSELLAKLGNLINRVVKLVNSPKAYSGIIPDFTLTPAFDLALAEVTSLLTQYITAMESVHLRAAAGFAMRLAEAGNGLIQSHKLDNNLIASEPARAAAVVGVSANLCLLLAAVFAPFTPAAARSICAQWAVPADTALHIPNLADLERAGGWRPAILHGGHRIGKAELLFTRIDPKQGEEWRELFGGSQAERNARRAEAEKVAAKKAANKASKAKKKEKKGAEKEQGEGHGEGGEETPEKKATEEANEADGVAQITEKVANVAT